MDTPDRAPHPGQELALPLWRTVIMVIALRVMAGALHSLR
jgi:hypothetical protein